MKIIPAHWMNLHVITTPLPAYIPLRLAYALFRFMNKCSFVWRHIAFIAQSLLVILVIGSSGNSSGNLCPDCVSARCQHNPIIQMHVNLYVYRAREEDGRVFCF